MDNTETSLREIMVALLALGPASGPDQAAMRKAIGHLLQSPPNEEQLAKAWRDVRKALEELQAPPSPPAKPLTPADQEHALKNSWANFAHGKHADPDFAAFPDGAEGVVTALRSADTKGESAALTILSQSVESLKAGVTESPADRWAAVELAALAPADKTNPSRPTKWDARAEALRQLKPDSESTDWVGRMAEARRRLLLGEALGRSFGVQFGEIEAELDEASRRFNDLGEPHGVGLAELVRGRAHAWRGQLMEASESLSVALVAFFQLGNRFRMSDAAYELGVAYRELHRFEAARRVQAQNVALEIQRGQVDALTRAMQSYAMTHVNEARLTGTASPADKSARMQLLAKARLLAWRAFEMVKTRPEPGPEGPPPAPSGEAAADLPQIIGREPNEYRAVICARDLSEIALLSGNEDLARGWLERAKAEAHAAPAPGQSMVDAFVMPAFSAVGQLDPEDARKRLADGTKFELVRLAELELRFSSREQRTPLERAKDLDLVARAWDIQKLPAYAIEAWLNAADVVTGRAAPEEPETLAARHWRYLALRQAANVGSSIHARGVVDSPVELSEIEKAVAAAANVSVLQLIDSRGEARTYRVRDFDALTTSRLLVRTPAPQGWEAQRRLLEAVSRQRPGVPRILRSGTEGGAAWVLDEDVEGPTLERVMRDPPLTASRVMRMLGQLGDVLQALRSTGMPAAWPDAGEIVLAPGDKLVLRRYGELFLGSTPPASIKGPVADVSAYVELAKQWIATLRDTSSKHSGVLADIQRYEKAKPADQREALTTIASRFRDLADLGRKG
ncbi:MAG TPA: hypothetical protein VG942_16585 [Hyphomonadaceae bacterium]|nr:hypothetical protein [Hyphomonadaceae bacterium]